MDSINLMSLFSLAKRPAFMPDRSDLLNAAASGKPLEPLLNPDLIKSTPVVLGYEHNPIHMNLETHALQSKKQRLDDVNFGDSSDILSQKT